MSAQAEPVTLSLTNAITANAEYRVGAPDKPAVLLLHGFLQTHKFHTIHQLTENLHGEQFSVLAPTLSLNVPQRRKSLACEAIHTHTLQQSLSEITAWIEWLEKKGHRRVVLVGHSAGSKMLISYLRQAKKPVVEKLIGISIVEGRQNMDRNARTALMKSLQRRINSGNSMPLKQSYSYCNPIYATPMTLLSYLAWGPDQILQTIRETTLPLVFIMGGEDKELGEQWTTQLKSTGKPVHIIEGANHFMDGEYEFDLLDIILAELQ